MWPLDAGAWAMMFLFARLSHVGGLRASGGGSENGTRCPEGTKESSNAAGPKSFGFLGFGLVCGPTKNMVLGYGNQRGTGRLLVPGCE